MHVRFKRQSDCPLKKESRRGFRGFPIATVAYYGPDDSRASKIAVTIIDAEGSKPSALERWFSDESDLRNDRGVAAQIVRFVREHGAKSVVVGDRIIGCPHEEGIDYPNGEVCPQCPFWAHRDRWTGELLS